MDRLNLKTLGREQLAKAAGSTAGRSATTAYGARGLRQTVLALRAGSALAEHDSPGVATLLVLHGRVELVSGDEARVGEQDDLLVIPPARHSLRALDDAVVLLTVAKGR